MLETLEQFNKDTKPSNLEFIYYLFFTHGITLLDIEQLPVPYLMGILSTHSYVKEQEEKAYKKAQRR